MARRSIRPLFHIDDGYRILAKLAVSGKKTGQEKHRTKLLRNFQDFLTFLADVARRKSGFDIIVSENLQNPDHFAAHYLFFDPVDSEPQIDLLNQGYSCKIATIDGRDGYRGPKFFMGIFLLFRAFNVLKHCVCGNILPTTSVCTETCACAPRIFKMFRTSQGQALESYVSFTSCETDTIPTLWNPKFIRFPMSDKNVWVGELQDTNDCAAYVIYGLRLLYGTQQRPTSERLRVLEHSLTKAAVRFSRSTLISNVMSGVPRDSCWGCQIRLAKMFKCAQGCMFFLCELCSWEQTSIEFDAPTTSDQSASRGPHPKKPRSKTSFPKLSSSDAHQLETIKMAEIHNSYQLYCAGFVEITNSFSELAKKKNGCLPLQRAGGGSLPELIKTWFCEVISYFLILEYGWQVKSEDPKEKYEHLQVAIAGLMNGSEIPPISAYTLDVAFRAVVQYEEMGHRMALDVYKFRSLMGLVDYMGKRQEFTPTTKTFLMILLFRFSTNTGENIKWDRILKWPKVEKQPNFAAVQKYLAEYFANDEQKSPRFIATLNALVPKAIANKAKMQTEPHSTYRDIYRCMCIKSTTVGATELDDIAPIQGNVFGTFGGWSYPLDYDKMMRADKWYWFKDSRPLTTQKFLRTIRPYTYVASPTTSVCRRCTAPVDSSCAVLGLCKYCLLTTVEKQRTCCLCWSPMAPSPTASPGAPATSESPTSPSPAAVSPVAPPTDSPVDSACKILIPGIIQRRPQFRCELMKLQLQAIFPATGTHSVQEVVETALELWNISLADKADQPVSLKEFALYFPVLCQSVETPSRVDWDLLGTKSVMTCPVHTCRGGSI